MSRAHYLAGLPEWVDQETADATVEALGLAVAQDAEQPSAEAQQMSALRARWALIYRAAIVAAAKAIAARDWAAKNAALSVAGQAAEGRDVMIAAIFGTRDVPAGYAQHERAGEGVTDAQVRDALATIQADERAIKARQVARRAQERASRAAQAPRRAEATAQARVQAAAESAARKEARDAEATAALAAAQAQDAADLAVGRDALPEVIAAAVGGEWVAEGDVILGEDGSTYRVKARAGDLTDLGRMLRKVGYTASRRAAEVRRHADLGVLVAKEA